VVVEETAMSAIVPQQWYAKEGESKDQQGAPGNTSPPRNSEEPGHELEDVTQSGVFSPAAIWQWATGKKTNADQESSKNLQYSPQYRNFQTVKALLEALLPTALPLLQTYGKSLLLRRERDVYIRSHHVQLADDLSLAILQQLRVPDNDDTVRDFHYAYIMLHAVHELLVNPTADSK
jgi:E3 ubiquitin-protein ligase HUWE1